MARIEAIEDARRTGTCSWLVEPRFRTIAVVVIDHRRRQLHLAAIAGQRWSGIERLGVGRHSTDFGASAGYDLQTHQKTGDEERKGTHSLGLRVSSAGWLAGSDASRSTCKSEPDGRPAEKARSRERERFMYFRTAKSFERGIYRRKGEPSVALPI